MNKILVSVRCVATDEAYDVYIPAKLKISQISQLLGKGLEEMSDRKYVSSGKELLCMKSANILLEPEMTLNDYQVKNGDEILMF